MKKSEIQRFKSQCEVAARSAALDHDRYLWTSLCQQIWTLDFVLDLTQGEGYQHPHVRIPYVDEPPVKP